MRPSAILHESHRFPRSNGTGNGAGRACTRGAAGRDGAEPKRALLPDQCQLISRGRHGHRSLSKGEKEGTGVLQVGRRNGAKKGRTVCLKSSMSRTGEVLRQPGRQEITEVRGGRRGTNCTREPVVRPAPDQWSGGCNSRTRRIKRLAWRH